MKTPLSHCAVEPATRGSGAFQGRCRRIGSFSLALTLVLSGQVLRLAGQADDFNDGDDAGWIHWEPMTEQGSPTAIEVRERAYHLSVTARDSP
jgi:hypothetical protein